VDQKKTLRCRHNEQSTDYFDVSSFPFKDVFEGIDNVWDGFREDKRISFKDNEFRIQCDIPAGVVDRKSGAVAIGKARWSKAERL